MLVRGGSPVNGALSGRCGPTADHIDSNQLFLPVIWDASSGFMACSPLGLGPELGVVVAPGCPFNSSGRNARPSSVGRSEDERLSFAFSAAAASLRRATSGSLGHAGSRAAAVSFCGGGRLRLGGTTKGARSR